MWKAFDELEAVGLIGSERPRMYAVQAEGCAPIVRAFEAGEEFAERWENPATVATGIRVPKAGRARKRGRRARGAGGGDPQGRRGCGARGRLFALSGRRGGPCCVADGTRT